jgi:hypothetical protein
MIDNVLQETWRKRLEGFDQSGMSARDWCDKNNITLDRFYFWRRRFRTVPQQSAPQPDGWAVIEVAPTPVAIDVRVGAAVIQVPPGFDPDHLRAVVRALEANPC